MKNNLGSTDQMIRIALAVLISTLYFTQVISPSLALVSLLVIGILIITSFFSFCPIYYLFGISTKKKQNSKTDFFQQSKSDSN
ncbi:YgaP family membrane protein [Algoriphagus antarcticus]|uniref:Inner membrane protein YgaP-like transmembrane domain-containing protein n=1 Tax=Algoriphagus antarcticus TaxID=238540 RepID=A0A3E0E3S5_9BACT|nr:hypothetical protein C8N25_102292 [Algoriphagus antarcticus]